MVIEIDRENEKQKDPSMALVLQEPDEAMLDAGIAAIDWLELPPEASYTEMVKAIWKAMLEAS